jgi:hypothetical protein
VKICKAFFETLNEKVVVRRKINHMNERRERTLMLNVIEILMERIERKKYNEKQETFAKFVYKRNQFIKIKSVLQESKLVKQEESEIMNAVMNCMKILKIKQVLDSWAYFTQK